MSDFTSIPSNCFFAQVKFVPWSLLTVSHFPRIAVNLENALRKLETSIPYRGSKWIAREGRQTIIKTQIFFVDGVFLVAFPSWMKKCPKTSIPTCVNGGTSCSLSGGRSAMICSLVRPRSLRQITQLKMNFRTSCRPFSIK